MKNSTTLLAVSTIAEVCLTHSNVQKSCFSHSWYIHNTPSHSAGVAAERSPGRREALLGINNLYADNRDR